MGDIITYNQSGELIVYRVIEKGIDKGGVYFILKRDSNDFSYRKVRFEDIEYVLVWLVY